MISHDQAILTNDGGDTFKTVMSTLKQIGSGAYHVSHKVLDTQDAGSFFGRVSDVAWNPNLCVSSFFSSSFFN